MHRSSSLLHIGLVLCTSLFLTHCGQKAEFVTEKELTMEEKLDMVQAHLKHWVLDSDKDSVVIDGFRLYAYQQLYRLYDTVGFKLQWFKELELTKRGEHFLDFIGSIRRHGLDSNLYFLNEIRYLVDSVQDDPNFVSKARNIALCDVLMSNAYLLVNVHLEKGFIDPVSGRQVYKIDSLKTRDPVKEYMSFKDTSHYRLLTSRQPANIEYRYLMTALQRFVDSIPLDTRKVQIPDLKTDSLACRDSLAVFLAHYGWLDTAFVGDDSAEVASLKAYQEWQGLDKDGIPGNYTVACARLSHYDRFLQASLAVEKWKWKEPRDGSIRVHVNIPAYRLHLIRNDSLIRKHRVVTGLPDKQTPEFTACMKWVTLFPYWNVPHSIATEEIAPYLRRSDTTYLNKHGYELFLKKEPADLSQVKWKKLCKDYFPYRIRQKGGPKNSLGLIQFHFPNKHDVYLHDTPAKYFFKKNTRAFSHGCIRLEDPFAFGTTILQQDRPKDTINIDTVMAWINKGEEQRIILKKYIPVEIDYISVTADSLGNITFHYDIYQRDEKYLKNMRPGVSPIKMTPKKKEKTPADSTRNKELAWYPSRRYQLMRA